MCLIAFGWQAHPQLALVVAANRDEFHARPTAAAHWWDEPAGLFAGRDLQAGGAWCGMDRRGRFAAVTNVREPGTAVGRLSRGLLVRDYFAGGADAADWAARMAAADDTAFSPFNLLVGDTRTFWFVSNRGAVRHTRLGPGAHAVSNGHWGDHWPKTERAQTRLAEMLTANQTAPQDLFALLADTDSPPAVALPDTGVGAEREAFLSPLFIRSAVYGTRASTVITHDIAGNVDFHERGFDEHAQIVHRVAEHWTIEEVP